MKTYLIKLNSEDKRKKGIGWMIQEYENESCSGEAKYIDAKHILISNSSTFEFKNGYFIKSIGILSGNIEEYIIK